MALGTQARASHKSCCHTRSCAHRLLLQPPHPSQLQWQPAASNLYPCIDSTQPPQRRSQARKGQQACAATQQTIPLQPMPPPTPPIPPAPTTTPTTTIPAPTPTTLKAAGAACKVQDTDFYRTPATHTHQPFYQPRPQPRQQQRMRQMGAGQKRRSASSKAREQQQHNTRVAVPQRRWGGFPRSQTKLPARPPPLSRLTRPPVQRMPPGQRSTAMSRVSR